MMKRPDKAMMKGMSTATKPPKKGSGKGGKKGGKC